MALQTEATERLPRIVPSLFLILAAVGLSAAPVAGQAVTGHLEGRVQAADGSPLAGAVVEVSGTGLPGSRYAETGRGGRYRVEELPVGRYDVRVRQVGYRPVVFGGLLVRLGQTTEVITAILEPMSIDVAPLEVTATRPLIDPAAAEGGGSLLAEQFDLLPIDRNYRALPALLPGVNLEREGLNIEGATGLENQYFIDGANVTDPGTGNSSTLLPPNFVQEVEVRSGGYEAEYGGTLGGTINIVTRSGGDRFSAETFGYLVSNDLTATPQSVPGNTATGRFTRYDAGASISGPITRGKLWFFGAVARAVEREEIRIPSFGTPDAEILRTTFAGKLTWQPGQRSTVVASLIGDPANGKSVGSSGDPLLNPDPLLGAFERGGVSASLRWTFAATPRLLLQSTASWGRQYERQGAGTALGALEPTYHDTSGAMSGGYPVDARIVTHRLNAGMWASYQAGSHQLKAGLGFSEQRFDQDFRQVDIFREDTSHYTWSRIHQFGQTWSRVPAVFVQDGWAVTNRLRFNLGVRWEGQYFFGSDDHLSMTIKDQWQPRLGLVYLADAAGRSRVFASYGRFYQDLQQTLGSLYFAYGTRFDFNRSCTTDPRVDTTGCGAPAAPITRGPNPDIEGQSFDEWSVGYERAVGSRLRGRARAVHRRLRWGVEDAEVVNGPDTAFVVGNPGRGVLRGYPRMRREYTALELGVEGTLTRRLWILASYVLSRTYGNHSGLYNSDEGYIFPNVNGAYDIPEILVDGTGRLPNDRPHVFKFNATYQLHASLTVGTSLAWQSGTPINAFGRIAGRPGYYHSFEVPRGTAGRTPATWDLGLRFSWAMDEVLKTSWQSRLLLDLYHVGSPREVLSVNQVKYNGANKTSPAADYREPLSFQPPMTARVGLVVGF